jgi:hypothetical protein
MPVPPPLTPEQFFQLQMQMMATLNNIVQTLQQIHTQPPPPPPQQPRDRCADFLRGYPPTFSHAVDPLQADDWLRSVERQLDVAQCDSRELSSRLVGVLPSLGPRCPHLGLVSGMLQEPPHPRLSHEDEAQGVPCA